MKPVRAAACASGLWIAAALGFSQEAAQRPAPPAQNPAQSTPAAQDPNAPEMATHDVVTSFVSRVNLVAVPVVVRNTKGDAIGTLTKENFAVFDKGKPQEIRRFAIEDLRTPANAAAKAARPLARPGEPAIIAPERYVAYIFDDLNFSLESIVRLRKAAIAHLEKLRPTDRAAIYSLAGEVNVDFTDNRQALYNAIGQLRPSVMTRVGGLTSFDIRVRNGLQNIDEVVRHMGTLPGQRIVVVISPGFLTTDPEYFALKNQIIERAIRNKVVISAMDARGLYTDPAFDAAPRGQGSAQARSLLQADRMADVMAELSAGTGGQFYHNSNDFDEGFRRLAATPDFIYILGFSPQNLKSDGSFHGLKVSLKGVSGFNVDARRGYYAPRKTDDAIAVAKEEIQSALFSREELSELPIAVQTQYFKSSDVAAKLTVLVHLDVKLFKFRRADGRNSNNITIISGLFDRNGNYVQGIQKVMELHLKDETMSKIGNGFTIKTDFDVKPGTYLVRTVVRDTEAQNLSSVNGAVNIL